MRLETRRLFLREMNRDDYDALYRVLADAAIMTHYPYRFDEARVRAWIDRNVERYRIYGFGLWAVCLRDTGEMIGDCGLTMQDIGGVIKPEIGYHIRRDMQRRGYAREAALAVRDWTFETLPFNEIYSYMKYTNTPSARCAASWGCVQVDEFEDAVNTVTSVFRITRAEWEKLRGDAGEVLRLRPYRTGDAERIVRWCASEEAFYRWSAGILGEYPIDAARFRAAMARWDDDRFFPFVLTRGEEAVGFFTLRHPGEDRRELRFGFVIVDPALRGKGFGRRMLELGIRYAFGVYGAEKVSLGVFENNPSAHRCYRRAGFVETGIVNEYDILGEKWKCVELERQEHQD